MPLKQEIEKEALGLGFSAFGVAGPDYDPIGHNRLLNWIRRGYQADLKYMERGPRQRFDPRIHLQSAESVIVCAMNYYTPPRADSRKGYISIYARGANYHAILGEKLNRLCDRIRQLAGGKISFKVFVDSSPVAEKPLAVRAGLGFIGRNGVLIIPRSKSSGSVQAFGSFHFLGVIITDLKLEPDKLGVGTCGQCRRCIEACPTGAIVENCVIDSNRCLSYHNTQSKGKIPDFIADALGNMIYGCDICQIVCPYNSKAAETKEAVFAPRPEFIDPDIEELSSLTEEEFKNRFGNSSIGELDYGLFKRNIGIAAQNVFKDT